MNRIVLLGSGSFIAQAVAKEAAARGLPHAALRHDAPLDQLTEKDCLINFSLMPAYRSEPYDPAFDCDLRAARAAAQSGAGFVMLSTRRVYGPETRWNAQESQPAPGEGAYGRNKAVSEIAVMAALQGRAGIFRLSNIFGYEYDRTSPRRTFLGILLNSLKQKNVMYFDMSASTRRDFLPVEICARLLLDRAVDRTAGTWNLGSGIPLPCGALADWIREGYGGGDLVCEPDIPRDEFYLSMDKWRAHFPLSVTKDGLRDHCIGLGRRLKCEQS